MSFLEFVEGPLFYFAAAVFVLAALWRFAGIVRLGRRKDIAPPKGSGTAGFFKENIRHFIPREIFTKWMLTQLFGGYAFHLGLFALLLFAAPHVAFLSNRILWGLHWPTLPRWGFIVAAEFAFAGLIVLWVRRFSNPVMRMISDWDDHIGSWLTFIVMLSGCFAMQESHVALRATHMLLVDIWLIYFPFSRLMHTFTFFLSRGNTGITYGRKGMNP